MKSPLFTQKRHVHFIFMIAILWFSACDNSSSLEETVISDTPTEEETPPTEPSSLLRINSGGGEVQFGDITFLADDYFRGNSETFSNPSVTEINGTEEDEIYFTERIADVDLGSFGYQIPITDGTYTLNLYFAEIWFGAPDGGAAGPNNRIFDIAIEGETRLMNFDITDEVGATTASIQTFTVEVRDGHLNFELLPNVDRPKISAFEIIGDGEILEETVSEPSDPIRINSGGGDISAGGHVFMADTFFRGEGESFTNPSVAEIAATDDDELYLTERVTIAGQNQFGYDIPVNDGMYTVNLHFAEIWWGAPDGGVDGPGNRVFDVSIEGDVRLMDFDINREVGTTTAIVQTFMVEVRDGRLNIDFSANIDRPKISALEVIGMP